MVKIGLLSDTHGFLDEAVYTYFKSCDEIWHAGDFGDIHVVQKLQAFKPLRAVYGNIDGSEIRAQYPEVNRFTCGGMDVMMIHIGGYPGRYQPNVRTVMQENPPQLFISGHSHILKVMYDRTYHCLHINPGAAGKQGWQKVRTLIRFSIADEKAKDLEVIELGNT